MFCTHCGGEVKEGQKFCTNCGAPIERQAPAPRPATYQEPAFESSYSEPVYSAPGYRPSFNEPLVPYSTGGLIAWSILNILCCCLPLGIVSLVMACNINNATSAADQRNRVKNTKTWCIIGTVVGVIFTLLGTVLLNAVD